MERKDHHGSGLKLTTKRFLGPKHANSGKDPSGAYLDFLKKEIVRNIDVHKETSKRADDLNSRKDKVALGCTKKILETKSLSPRVPYVLLTDHITISPDASKPGISSKSPIPIYSKLTPSLDSWEAFKSGTSFSNYQKTGYNIITLEQNKFDPPSLNSSNRKKGLSEFLDLHHASSPNTNHAYSQALQADPKVFYRKTGMFSNMYDAAARHGNLIMPFDKSEAKQRN